MTGSIRNSIWLTTADQRLAHLENSAALSNARKFWLNLVGGNFANVVTREPKCRRITIRLWRRRYSLSGDSSKRILVAGYSE
jgi:hypothetical protein